MEKKQKNKYDYSAISIKAEVAVHFRRYSKQFSKSNTEVLQRMMVFLQWNGLKPFDNTIEKIVSAIENIEALEFTDSLSFPYRRRPVKSGKAAKVFNVYAFNHLSALKCHSSLSSTTDSSNGVSSRL